MSFTFWITIAAKLGCIILLLLLFARGTVVFALNQFKQKQQRLQYSRAVQYVQQQRAIADFSFLGQNTLRERLWARAVPNQRLVAAFGIDNPFTTTDETAYREFFKMAKGKLNAMDPGKWSDFFLAAGTALKRVLGQYKSSQDSLPLASVVRQYVFISVLRPFFDVGPEHVDLADVIQATDLINDLWVRSKETPLPDLREGQEQLDAALQRMLPNRYPCSPEARPLNLIIPVYEAMWQAVLLTFVSAGFRAADQETTEQFRRVVAGVPECFDVPECESELGTTALNFAKEGLRLYPPTKRIHRASPARGPGGPRDRKADVERCQRDPRIWAEPWAFRPSRFGPAELAPAARAAFFPFGAGPHQCPAGARFAPRAIITLVVVLARALGTGEGGARMRYGMGEEEGDGNGEGGGLVVVEGPLPSGRRDMDGWRLDVRGSRGSGGLGGK